MDDCSPDDTPSVAKTFTDPRVRYYRNDPNLGSLRNYNKGIGLARGAYIWLISADDYLRKPYIVERYVRLMEANPGVGYVFCSGVGVLNGRETGLLTGTQYSKRDRVVAGHQFLKRLLHYNLVLAPSGMVRRECYEKNGLFPLDPGMVWSGDWYLWCLFALSYDVGFLAEPMVCYRQHELSMTNLLRKGNTDELFEGDIAVPWMMKRKADERGLRAVRLYCMKAVAAQYALCIDRRKKESPQLSMSVLWEKLEASLVKNTPSEYERKWLRSRIAVGIADYFYWAKNPDAANTYYQKGLQLNPFLFVARLKQMALSLGGFGDALRRIPSMLRG